MNRTFKMLALLCFLISANAAFSQNDSYQVTKGKQFPGRRAFAITGIIGEDETGYYVLSRKGLGRTYLDHVNTELTVDNSKEIELPMEKKDRKLETIIQLDGKLILFSSLLDKDLQKNILFMESVDKTTLSPNGDITKLAEIDFDKKRNSGSFNFEVSDDTSKVLIHSELPYEKNGAERFNIQVFDSQMERLWEKNIELPYSDELFATISYTVDNEGEVAILGKLYKEKVRDKMAGNVNYKHIILRYSDDEDEPDEYEAELAGKFLKYMKIAVDKKGNIVCAGFYADKSNVGIKGTFYLCIDRESKSVLREGSKEFSLDFITSEMTEKEKRKTEKKAGKGKEVVMLNYSLDHLIIKDDNSAVLVAEQWYYQRYTNTSTVNGVTMTTYTYKYYYNDILVIDIGKDGEIEWATIVPKRQTSVNDNGIGLSYALASVDDHLYFVFNDDERNLDPNLPKEKRKVAGGKRQVTVVVDVNEKGEQNKTMIVSVKEGAYTRPRYSRQIGPSSMLLFGQNGKRHQYSRLELR